MGVRGDVVTLPETARKVKFAHTCQPREPRDGQRLMRMALHILEGELETLVVGVMAHCAKAAGAPPPINSADTDVDARNALTVC
jgi:hypothetical protein